MKMKTNSEKLIMKIIHLLKRTRNEKEITADPGEHTHGQRTTIGLIERAKEQRK